jgi:hypothetical protein
MATTALLFGTGVAVADVYLNFSLTCNSQQSIGSGSCPKDATVFQGSVDLGATAPANGTYTGTVILDSATVYLNGGNYSATGIQATALGTNSAQVTYTCNGGQCYVTSVSLGVQTASGTYYFQSNSSGANTELSLATRNGSSWAIGDKIGNSLKAGCVGPASGAYCALTNEPMHHPEINGATLPKAALLLGSLFLFMRERRQRAA